jgi:hypothetical protein
MTREEKKFKTRKTGGRRCFYNRHYNPTTIRASLVGTRPPTVHISKLICNQKKMFSWFHNLFFYKKLQLQR